MAELIDKMQGIMCKSCTSCEANWCDGEDKSECQWMQEIAEVGITTESEIRAKAIDELVERIKIHVKVVGTTYLEDIDEIAEQLKERE